MAGPKSVLSADKNGAPIQFGLMFDAQDIGCVALRAYHQMIRGSYVTL